MPDDKIKDAMDAVQEFLNNKEERRRYINREMALMDRRSELASAREEGKAEGLIESIANLMASCRWSIEQAMDALKIPEKDRPRYLDLLQKKLH